MKSLATSMALTLVPFLFCQAVFAETSPRGVTSYEKCTAPISLKGTVYAEGKPEWSQAQILTPGFNRAQTYTLKRPWLDSGLKLVEIGEGFVVLQVSQEKKLQKCYTADHEFTKPADSTTQPKLPAEKPIDKFGKQIQTAGPDIKAALDELAALPGGGVGTKADYNKYGFWSPNFKNKAVFMNRIRPNTPVYKMGLRANDVLFSVNGVKVKKLGNKVQNIFNRLPTDTDRLVFEVKRRGKRIKVEYQP